MRAQSPVPSSGRRRPSSRDHLDDRGDEGDRAQHQPPGNSAEHRGDGLTGDRAVDRPGPPARPRTRRSRHDRSTRRHRRRPGGGTSSARLQSGQHALGEDFDHAGGGKIREPEHQVGGAGRGVRCDVPPRRRACRSVCVKQRVVRRRWRARRLASSAATSASVCPTITSSSIERRKSTYWAPAASRSERSRAALAERRRRHVRGFPAVGPRGDGERRRAPAASQRAAGLLDGAP